MADPKGGGGPNPIQDLWSLLIILGVLWVFWYMTGGPSRAYVGEGLFLNPSSNTASVGGQNHP